MAIKNFGWAFIGWVDLDDAGFAGTPIDDRRFTKEFLATPLEAYERMAVLMDGLGYDALYTTEHHFQPEGIEVFPNPLLISMHMASKTSNLRFGQLFNILPQWHPVRLAEDYALADILTKGRMIFGVGRGSQTRELESFGAPMLDQNANRDLFEEQVELVLKCFHDESFSHQGTKYTIPPAVPYRTRILEEVTAVPRPLYSTDVWQAIASGRPRGIEFMAKHGIKGIFIPALTGDKDTEYQDLSMTTSLARLYQEAGAKYGRELALGEDLGAYVMCHLGDSRKDAAREIELFEQECFKRLAGVGGGPSDAFLKEIHWRDKDYKGFTMDQLTRLGDRRTAAEAAHEMGYRSLEERAEVDRAYLFGPSEEIIAGLKELEELYPAMETVILHPPEMTPSSLMLEQMERFAKEVLPAFPDAIHTNREWPNRFAQDDIVKYHPEFGDPAVAP